MEVNEDGRIPTSCVLGEHAHYMRAQGRVMAALELWSLGRGNDLRGGEDDQLVSVAKLFGAYSPRDIIGPDPFYKMQLLKDESKANTEGRPELIGTQRSIKAFHLSKN